MIVRDIPPDGFMEILSGVRKVYCEDDFLLHSKSVAAVGFSYDELNKAVTVLEENAEKYQAEAASPYNGYNTLTGVARSLVDLAIEDGQSVLDRVANLNTVKQFLRMWCERFSRMTDILNIAADIRKLNTGWSLFPDNPDSTSAEAMEISRRVINLDPSPFYGEIQSFHLKGDIKIFTAMLHKAMLFYYGYSHYQWKDPVNATKNWMENVKCVFDDQLRSKKVVDISKEMGVLFAKDFFQMGEALLPKSLKKLVLAKVKTSVFIEIPLTGPVEIPHSTTAVPIVVYPPRAPLARTSLRARFIADFPTPAPALPSWAGQSGTCCMWRASSGERHRLRDSIILHLHGGGWVAQSPESHLDYLHQWARDLDTPILSVDYSLAPESPYPRACEEVFYSYVWMLGNLEKLGSSGKKILVSGDSCGGNLATGLVLRCIIHNVRLPDGLHISYASLLTQFYPSPSRLLMLFDPLLMVGILGKCINAYKDKQYMRSLPRTLEQELQSATSEKDIFLSPMLADESLLKSFPPTLIIETDVDACLDENVLFYSKLVNAGVRATLEVLPGLPHGFLAFCNMSKDCQTGVSQVINSMKRFLSEI